MVTFEQIKNSKEISTYIRKGNEVLGVLGYTEHGFGHAEKTARKAAEILNLLNYDDRTIELARISGYMHDIGNCINRHDHAQSGAIMAFRILDRMGMPADELAEVIGAIGNHDEATGTSISPVSAALILADKSDVRRSRVRERNSTMDDIHDRVNYAVHESHLIIKPETKEIVLSLEIDTSISAVMDYFEIFLSRMLMCRKAATYLGLNFQLDINSIRLL